MANDQLAEACSELQGTYTAREIASRCRNSPDGQVNYVFEIVNATRGNAQISQDECERNIGAQVDNCGRGGETEHSGIRFRYVLYNRSWSTRLLLLTQIGAIRINASARHSNILGGVTHRCGWSIRITCELRRKGRKGLKGLKGA